MGGWPGGGWLSTTRISIMFIWWKGFTWQVYSGNIIRNRVKNIEYASFFQLGALCGNRYLKLSKDINIIMTKCWKKYTINWIVVIRRKHIHYTYSYWLLIFQIKKNNFSFIKSIEIIILISLGLSGNSNVLLKPYLTFDLFRVFKLLDSTVETVCN